MDPYATDSLIKALADISHKLGELEELPDRVDYLSNDLEHIGTQLERIADVMELDSDRHQEKLRQKAAELQRRAEERGPLPRGL
jgi:hypothetical protein